MDCPVAISQQWGLHCVVSSHHRPVRYRFTYALPPAAEGDAEKVDERADVCLWARCDKATVFRPMPARPGTPAGQVSKTRHSQAEPDLSSASMPPPGPA